MSSGASRLKVDYINLSTRFAAATETANYFQFDPSSISGINSLIVPNVSSSDTLVVLSTAQTLSNKTLTSPIINQVIDSGGTNEVLIFGTTASAVNEVTITNAATGNGPTIAASGETNVDLNLAAKGTGAVTLGSVLETDNDIDTATAVVLSLGATNATSIDVNSKKITSLATPTASTDAATKAYVDATASGLDVKLSCRIGTTQDVAAEGTSPVYSNTGGASSRGQITWTTGPTTIDGVTLANGDRMLLKDQTNGDENGIWVRTSQDTWDRATDFDEDAEVTAGAFAFVEEGTACADCGFVLATDNPITIGGASGTSLSFTQFSGAGQITAGNGLDKSGNTLSVDLKANGGLVIESTEVAVDLGASSITGTLAVGDGGTGSTSFTAAVEFITSNAGGTAIESSGKSVPTGVVVGNSDTQTLTNKTMTSNTNNVIARELWIGSGSGSVSTYAASAPSNGDILTATGATTATWQTPTSAPTNFSDADFYVRDDSDATKRVDFQLAGATTSTTATIASILTVSRTITIPALSANDTFVFEAHTQTLTNKTLTSPAIGTSILDTNGNELALLTATGSAVNEFTLANAATGSGPTLSATGDDPNIDINLTTKGTGAVNVSNDLSISGDILDSNSNELILLTATGSAVNEFTIANAATGSGPTLSATGTDANVDINLTAKGTGTINFNSPVTFANDITNNGLIISTPVSVSTTNNTQTTLITIATVTNTAYAIEFIIAAVRTDTFAQSASYAIRGGYKNDGGTVIKVGEEIVDVEDDNTWDVDVNISTTNILVQVTGPTAATNITWKGYYRLLSVP